MFSDKSVVFIIRAGGGKYNAQGGLEQNSGGVRELGRCCGSNVRGKGSGKKLESR
jgi:hypothetical protein